MAKIFKPKTIAWIMVLAAIQLWSLPFSPRAAGADMAAGGCLGPTPVIIVPGTGESRLVDYLGQIIWINLSSSALEEMIANDDGTTRFGLNADAIFDSGDLYTVGTFGKIDYYGSLLSYLQGSGIPVEVFPYDWRLDVGQNSEKLAEFIATVSAKYGGQVDIISHSQGGLIVKDYIAGHSGDIKIRKFIAIAPDQYGAPKSFGAWATGDMGQGGLFASYDITRKIAHNSPAIYQQMPSEKYFEYYQGYLNVPTRYGQPHLLSFEETRTWMLNPSQDGDEPAYMAANQKLLAMDKALHERIDDLDIVKTKTVDGYIIAGTGQATPMRFSLGGGAKLASAEVAIGDGVVPTLSATGGYSFQDGVVDKIYYSTAGWHWNLCSLPAVMNQCANILQGRPDDSVEGITKTPPDESSLGDGYLLTAPQVEVSIPAGLNYLESVAGSYNLLLKAFDRLPGPF